MNDDVFYAHSLPDRTPHDWERLELHLREVARLAGSFAAAFGAKAWGELAGLWHDLGKFKPEFQARLRGSREQVEHAGVGAALAASKGGLGQALAFVIAGHHAGLANLAAQGETTQRALRDRVTENLRELQRLQPVIPAELLNRSIPLPPAHLQPAGTGRSQQETFARRVEFWTRFVFSALVDADYLATEEFYAPRKRESVRDFDSIAGLRTRLEQHLAQFRADSPVNRLRAEVLEACRAAADLHPGLFSLTVPTGGGKTLSSMAFALRHSERHGLRRVIVVIPYTSIIEQNARVYREVVGERNVVEHHSNIDEARRLEENSEVELRRRLAAENWDAPIVVTTNVQFFESLFANRASGCRKLHNIAGSVVVLDEAQSLPAGYLNCVLEAMRELTAHYRCSLVLMTATQPALERRDTLPAGLENVHEIIPDVGRLAQALERVSIHWPDPDTPPTPFDELAESLVEHEQVLAIVHRRKDARELAQHLSAADRLHLSALMCAAHRTEVLDAAKARLARGEPCLLVSTQLIEAGVDISFPVVYRALAGLDSLAQAAGRCNREGELRDEQGNLRTGDFHVFRAETTPPLGILRMGVESMDTLLRRYGERMTFSDAALLEEYFRILFGKCKTDAKGIQSERSQFNFATVAHRVRLIEDDFSRPIVVPWGDAATRVAAFRERPGRETQRALQPYLVQIPEWELDKLRVMGAVERIHDRIDVLLPQYAHLYDAAFGLVVDESAHPDPSALVIGG